MLRKHVGLNYSFGLNNYHFIDSARVGCETRYINHCTEEQMSQQRVRYCGILFFSGVLSPTGILLI